MSVVTSIGEFFLLLARSLMAAFQNRPRLSIVVDQLHEVGVRSLSIATLTAVFTGMVMALQLGVFLTQFGAKMYVSRVVGVAVVSEMGPVLTALMIGGRVGAGIAAELGTMKVTEQVDALRALGTDPISHLVLPRLLGVIIMLPLLTAMSDVIGIVGGMFVAYFDMHVSPAYFASSLISFLTIADVVRSMVKALVFAIIIGGIACLNGITADGGADGVGRAVTRTVVLASITVLVSDFFLTKLMI